MKKILYLTTLFALGLARSASAGDLIAYWNFDTVGSGLSVDVQAGNVGSLLGGTQFTDAGTGHTGAGTDRAMRFGTGAQRMHVADASFLDAAGATNSISISFWQNLTTVRNETAFWANATSMPRAFSSHAPWSDGSIYWDTAGCCDGAAQRISFNPGATWVSTWNHVVLVKNGAAKRIYVNGVEVINGSSTAPFPTDFSELFIGNNANLAEAVDGSLDDIAIFSRELTPVEIADLYSGAKTPDALDPPNDTDADNLPDAWELRFAADLTILISGGDADSDGLPDEAEFARGTNPNNNDTDGDGALDGAETGTGVWVSASDRGTNPFVADTDGDGLKDGAETNTGTFVSASDTGSNPLLTDSDYDGFSDGSEVIYSDSDPTIAGSRPLRPGQLDLLAYWDFNDDTDPATTLDQVKGFAGALKPGTAFSADTTGRTGSAGDRAVDMGAVGNSGTGVVVNGGGFLNIAAAQDQVAISFWQNLAATPDSSSIYANSTSVERGINVHSPWSNGRVYFDTVGCCNGTTQRIDEVGGFTVGEWQHVVLNKNGDTKAIWVNGVKIKEGTNTNDLPTNFTRFIIGSDAGTLNMAGLMDDVAVYGDALTDAEIGMLFSGVAPNDPSLVPPNLDTDGDGMWDAYEDLYGLDKNADDANLDLDVDGLDNISEYRRGSLPNNPDTDGDTLSDLVETNTRIFVSASDTGTSPLLADTDGDTLSDADEINGMPATNPTLADTDGDGDNDSLELTLGTDPNDAGSVSPPGTVVIVGTVGEFTGPDDLHLDPATAVVAVDLFGDGDREVNGVLFKTDGRVGGRGSASGHGATVTTTATNQINDWAGAPAFTGGDPTSAANLAEIMRDIRYEGAPNPVRVDISGLYPGGLYDIQLLFNEGGDRNRRWDIAVEDELVVDDMTSEGTTSMVWTASNSAFYRGEFAAPADGILNVRLQRQFGGRPFPGGDGNPIIQAVVVHLDRTDTDSDGLPDWYEDYNGLNPNVADAADLDNDGSPNANEFDNGTDPMDPDSDGDGLPDGSETNTGIFVGATDTGTDPAAADSDGDGLGDGEEINGNPATDPTLADTDGDGDGDGFELEFGTDPTNAGSFSPATIVLVGEIIEFKGPDDLHLDPATSVIAVNLYGDADGVVNGVNFQTDGQAAGSGSATNGDVTVTTTAANQINDWAAVQAFTGTDPTSVANLAAVMQDIRWNGAPNPISIAIAGLTPGSLYEVQLLVNENGDRMRQWDIGVEGELVVDNFTSEGAEGIGVWASDNSFAYVGEFEAPEDGILNIALQQHIGGRPPRGTDNNPILQAVVVHTATPATPFVITAIDYDTPTGLWTITWNSRAGAIYGVDFSPDMSDGSWIELDDGITSEGEQTSFTDPVAPTGARGYYRVRIP